MHCCALRTIYYILISRIFMSLSVLLWYLNLFAVPIVGAMMWRNMEKVRRVSNVTSAIIVNAPIGPGATRRPRPLRSEWHAEIRVVGGISSSHLASGHFAPAAV
jgi:hypothetical protein